MMPGLEDERTRSARQGNPGGRIDHLRAVSTVAVVPVSRILEPDTSRPEFDRGCGVHANQPGADIAARIVSAARSASMIAAAAAIERPTSSQKGTV